MGVSRAGWGGGGGKTARQTGASSVDSKHRDEVRIQLKERL